MAKIPNCKITREVETKKCMERRWGGADNH